MTTTNHGSTPYAPVASAVKTLIKAAVPGPARSWIRRQRQWRQDKNLFLRHLRPSDVFLIGHPKSGNTWLAYMLAIILHRDDRADISLANVGNFVPTIHARDAGIAEYQHLPDPRVFRNEMPRFAERYPKIVYLMRDPRAVLVSLYHMYNTIFADKQMTLHAFLREYLTHGCIRSWEPLVIRWDWQVAAWMARAERDERVMLVRYEDMVRDRKQVLRNVMLFSGVTCAEDDLELAVTRGSFDAMQQTEKRYGAESYPGEIGKRGRFIRRGKVDGWRNELDPAETELIVREFDPVMRAVGYL